MMKKMNFKTLDKDHTKTISINDKEEIYYNITYSGTENLKEKQNKLSANVSKSIKDKLKELNINLSITSNSLNKSGVSNMNKSKLFNLNQFCVLNDIKRERVNSENNKQRRVSTLKSNFYKNNNLNTEEEKPLVSHGLSMNKERKKNLEDYKIEKTIGCGTFGEVKTATHLPSGERVAIKILEKKKMKEKEDFDRTKREMNILRKLKHDNIIQVYDIVEDENNFYLVMELVLGGELFNLIVEKGKLNNRLAALFFFQLINGLEVIHLNDIAHRDLKPENLIFTEDKLLKIIDFGLSNHCKDKERLITPCGSPCYASPEMILGDDYEGKTIDIWACGIVLYAMVCGYLPFEEENNDLLFKSICKCELDFPMYVQSSAREMIRLLLNTDPEKRVNIKQIKNTEFYQLGCSEYRNYFSNDEEDIKLEVLNLLKVEELLYQHDKDIEAELKLINDKDIKIIQEELIQEETEKELLKRLNEEFSKQNKSYSQTYNDNTVTYLLIKRKISQNKDSIRKLTINKIRDEIKEKILSKEIKIKKVKTIIQIPEIEENEKDEYESLREKSNKSKTNKELKVKNKTKEFSKSKDYAFNKKSKDKDNKIGNNAKVSINIDLSNKTINNINVTKNVVNYFIKPFKEVHSQPRKKEKTINPSCTSEKSLKNIISSFKLNYKKINLSSNYCATEINHGSKGFRDAITKNEKLKVSAIATNSTNYKTNKNINHFTKSNILSTMNNSIKTKQLYKPIKSFDFTNLISTKNNNVNLTKQIKEKQILSFNNKNKNKSISVFNNINNDSQLKTIEDIKEPKNKSINLITEQGVSLSNLKMSNVQSKKKEGKINKIISNFKSINKKAINQPKTKPDFKITDFLNNYINTEYITKKTIVLDPSINETKVRNASKKSNK